MFILILTVVTAISQNDYNDDKYRQFLRRRAPHAEKADTLTPWDPEGKYLWDYFAPMYNCPYRDRLGALSEGGKVVCNWEALQSPARSCIIYSFGVRGDISFELELLRRLPKCTIYAFDPTVMQLPTPHSRIVFSRVGLGGDDNGELGGMPLRTLATLMHERNHTYIDLLKIDIEGSEWSSFQQISQAGTLAHIDQLLIELHFQQRKTNRLGSGSGVREVFHFFESLENAGLFPFSWELDLNPPGWFNEKPYCIEYSFVRPTSAFMTKSPLLSDASLLPARKYAIVVLFRYDTEKYINYIRSWLKSIEKSVWYPGVDVLLFHDSCFCEDNLSALTSMPLTFINVSHIFSPKKLPQNPICPPTEMSKEFGFGYKAMCHWWFIDVWKYVEKYDFVLRVDSDCLIMQSDPSPVHMWEEWFASDAFISPFALPDEADVTTGMEGMVREFATAHSLPFQAHPNPNTNIMGFKPVWLSMFRDFQNAVDHTNCTFLNRWGDLPLYGWLLSLCDIPIKPPCAISYYHGSHRSLVRPCGPQAASHPSMFRQFKRLMSSPYFMFGLFLIFSTLLIFCLAWAGKLCGCRRGQRSSFASREKAQR